MVEAYVAIRDDSGIRSLSVNERDFLRTCVHGNTTLRIDGRTGQELRRVRLQLGRWDNGAECTVQWGNTRVSSLCSAQLVPPSPDRPNEGMVNFTVELSPMAGSSFRQAPVVSTGPLPMGARGPNYSDRNQRLLANRILRSVERVIILGGALDTEALVLAPGKWVWRFTIALTILDDGGNILDASILAAMAALRHYRKPQVQFSGDDEKESGAMSLPTMIPSIVKEATPLPLHHTPLSVSFALVPADNSSNAGSTSTVAAIADPTDREELVQHGTVTIAMNTHSEVCLLDFGGGCEIPPSKLKECWKIAQTTTKQLCQFLEQTLQDANGKAQQERLEKLKQQQDGKFATSAASLPPNAPYFEQSKIGDEMNVEVEVDVDHIAEVEKKAEEAYRQQALDYSRGHVASKVREDSTKEKSSQQKGKSLIAAMLRSVNQGDKGESTRRSEEYASDVAHSVVTGGKQRQVTNREDSCKVVDKTKNRVAMDLNDDEDEEAPTILQSEFHSSSREEKAPTEYALTPPPNTNDEANDLSMAIKKKKKKAKKKKPT
ncbi:unnamed protein product [Cylindrotheca closterium]|uniref:Ribosomal RNA-processing protein 43 n=1 Tax=Cylindrotheca closterium TaxID=2856 RepID=A0AAD2CZ49_9STRA|nr:unnamed protein product [Cylindrotheca closterium]